jgi:NitT/TauT family transport system permease protein
VKSSNTFSRALVLDRSWSIFTDLSVAAAALAGFYALVKIASYWLGKPIPAVDISQSISALPLYAFYSIVRIGAAYVLSLLFAVGYGYVAAYNPRAEALMIAVLDILQSIPVLSFLPGVMLAMVALFPTRQLGIEMGAILLIFTGQVWNMAFSFYSSLKSIPQELREASNIYRFSAWQRFWQLELPYSAIGLVWNSMVSVAGGWFFLIACEMFVLGDRDFRLPGLGSYLQTAASTGNSRAVTWGLITMILIIVATDQLVWRPVIAWSDKFKFEMTESTERVRSPMLQLLQRSSFVTALRTKTIEPIGERIQHRFATRRSARTIQPLDDDTRRRIPPLTVALAALGGLVILYAALQAAIMLRHIAVHEYEALFVGAAATFLRVNIALVLASLWTIPVGVMIGFHPKLARITQPITQIAAAFPAPFLFPIIILALQRMNLGLGVGAILLMLLGTQWYILFNVIAGAMAIPSDLREVANLFRFTSLQKWTTVILPGIFPYLVTGLVTASGGAWNASIIAEYYSLRGHTLQTVGLGAQISAASDHGQFPILLAATLIMATMVVTINRLVWRKLYRLAETRYKLGG